MKVKILSCSDKQYWYWELVSGAMIRNELSGIRFFQEISRSRFALPTNAELEKQGIKFPKKGTGKFDHAWTDREIGHAKIVATSMEQHEVSSWH